MDRDYWIQDLTNAALVQMFFGKPGYRFEDYGQGKIAFDVPPDLLEDFKEKFRQLQQTCAVKGTPLNLDNSHLPPLE